jgi:hypothetical protein
MQAEKMREKVLEKARLEEEMAGKEGDESLKKIFSDKEVLTQAILQIKGENRATKNRKYKEKYFIEPPPFPEAR